MQMLRRSKVSSTVVTLGLCLAASADAAQTGLVFVSNERSSTITILNPADEVIGSFKTCGRPRGLRLTPDRKQLIVGCGSDDTIALYHVSTQKLTRRFRKVWVGGFLRYEWAIGEVSISGGWAAEGTWLDREGPAPFGTVSLLTRF